MGCKTIIRLESKISNIKFIVDMIVRADNVNKIFSAVNCFDENDTDVYGK